MTKKSLLETIERLVVAAGNVMSAGDTVHEDFEEDFDKLEDAIRIGIAVMEKSGYAPHTPGLVRCYTETFPIKDVLDMGMGHTVRSHIVLMAALHAPDDIKGSSFKSAVRIDGKNIVVTITRGE